jgi:archaemetzincin
MKAIVLWWIGAGPRPHQTLRDVGAHVGRVYGLPVSVWPSGDRPVDTFDPRRQQHASSRVLEWLIARQPPTALRTLGITDVDLFMPVLTFVYGEAQLNGRAAVVSTARLGGPPGRTGERLLAARLAKESVHELGHTFGLLHCDAAACVMKRSVTLAAIDAKATTLCGDCRTLLLERSLDIENDHDEGTQPHSRR